METNYVSNPTFDVLTAARGPLWGRLIFNMDYLAAKMIERKDHEPALDHADRRRRIRLLLVVWATATVVLGAMAVYFIRENAALRQQIEVTK